MDRGSEAERSLTTTGAPVTTYAPCPLGSRHCGIAAASRIRAIAARRAPSLRPGRSRTCTSAASFEGKR